MHDMIKIAISFSKIGLLGFGGGSAVAPLIEKECVVKRKWLDDEEFIDIVAMANSLPGPSMVEMATAIGYKKNGVKGAITAAFFISFPLCLIFTLCMILLFNYVDINTIDKVTSSILAVVCAILLSLIKVFFIQSKKELKVFYIVIISLFTASLIFFFKVTPSIIIVSMVLIVLLEDKINKKSGEVDD